MLSRNSIGTRDSSFPFKEFKIDCMIRLQCLLRVFNASRFDAVLLVVHISRCYIEMTVMISHLRYLDDVYGSCYSSLAGKGYTIESIVKQDQCCLEHILRNDRDCG